MTNQPTKSFIYVINNPAYDKEEVDGRWPMIATDVVQFLTHVREVAPTTGTPHMQGVGRMKKTTRPNAIAGHLTTFFGQPTHVEKMLGTYDQALEYTRKSGGVAETWGDLPKKGTKKKSSMDAVRDTIRSNPEMGTASLQALLYEDHFGTYVRYQRNIDQFIERSRRSFACRDVTVEWHYGATGTGKTHGIPRDSDSYWKPPEAKWFPGYTGQPTLVLDEFRKNWFTFSYMLRLLDVYPMQVEIKGGYVQLDATKIIITCPYHPRDLYPTREDVGQLVRRCTKIFKHSKEGDEYITEEVGDIMPQQELDFFSGDTNDIPDLSVHEYGTSYDFD